MTVKMLPALILISMLFSSCDGSPTTPAQTEGALPTTLTPEPIQIDATQTQTAMFEEATCPFELSLDQAEGETVECGYLTVPEDRTDPESRNIRLAVAIFRHPDGNPQPDPIIYLEGGPGASPLELRAANFAALFGSMFAAKRDIILIDPRGVGYSQPALDCPNFTQLYLDLLDFEIDGDRLSSQQVLDYKIDAFLTCAENLRSVADLSKYNTIASAADVNDLRRALGYEQVNLWGTSYGSRLALGVMRDFPEGVRSAILDGPAAPEVDLYLEAPKTFNRALNMLFADCAADEQCNGAFPNLRDVFFGTVEKLNENAATLEVVQAMTGESYPMLLDGDRLLELALRSLYSTNLRPALPEAFYEASTGNFSPFLPVIWNDIQAQDLRSRGNYFSVLCNEEVSFIPWNQFQAAVAEYPEFIGMYAGSEMGGLVYGVCEGWGAGQAEARENEAVQSQVPALIMTGQYDPVALPDWGALIAKSLPNGHYFEIKGMAHGVSLADCPLDLLLAFLENPSMAPDDTCIAEMGSPQFVLPVEEEVLWEAFENEDFGIQGLVPVGWDEVSSGIFARASSPTDLTVLLMQAAPVSASEILNSLAAQIDVEEIPESLDVREANNLSWTLYTVESQGLFRDIALADQDGMTLIVILRTTPDKHDALFETIFLPAVDELVLEE